MFPQVWLSVDGGNTFDLIDDFHGDIIKTTYHSFYTSDIVFVSTSGKAYLTKAGKEFAGIGVGCMCRLGIRRQKE